METNNVIYLKNMKKLQNILGLIWH